MLGKAMVIWSASYPVFVRTNLLHLETFRTLALCYLPCYLKKKYQCIKKKERKKEKRWKYVVIRNNV